MKGLILSALGGLLIASIGSGYADVIRVTVINESRMDAKVLNPSHSQTMPVSFGGAKMFTMDYKYPEPILMQGHGKVAKPCEWTMPVVGDQTISAITMNISSDRTTNTQTCLLSWQ